ncbi:hypothetical protein [Leptothoe kymatousa]|uniref:Uncharacterized protein n=1 Tax=Leptothoe kymatousa TAU-MAC 1615 TaxID=2364775 RepID=A0ABS5Y567_9CYAN|nr:hypothetical protein [Leptothoe kymatousa]MBT9312956.1 hypothetical protein [Leptothoe kymatousa TAU-MAC 1615]
MERNDFQRSLDNDFQRSLDIVVCVFKEKDITALNKVKDFLYSLPSPRETEEALAAAVLYFAKHDQQVFEWIIINQASLSPELDLFAYTRNLVRTRLIGAGWLQGKDFWFDLHSLLFNNELLKYQFVDYFRQDELALVKVMLQIKS